MGPGCCPKMELLSVGGHCGIDFSKGSNSRVSEKPKRAIRSSRMWVWMCSVGSAPSLERAENVATLMVTS